MVSTAGHSLFAVFPLFALLIAPTHEYRVRSLLPVFSPSPMNQPGASSPRPSEIQLLVLLFQQKRLQHDKHIALSRFNCRLLLA